MDFQNYGYGRRFVSKKKMLRLAWVVGSNDLISEVPFRETTSKKFLGIIDDKLLFYL